MIKDIEQRLAEIVKLWYIVDGPTSNKSLEAHRRIEALSTKHYMDDIRHLLMLLYVYESNSVQTIEEVESEMNK